MSDITVRFWETSSGEERVDVTHHHDNSSRRRGRQVSARYEAVGTRFVLAQMKPDESQRWVRPTQGFSDDYYAVFNRPEYMKKPQIQHRNTTPEDEQCERDFLRPALRLAEASLESLINKETIVTSEREPSDNHLERTALALYHTWMTYSITCDEQYLASAAILLDPTTVELPPDSRLLEIDQIHIEVQSNALLSRWQDAGVCDRINESTTQVDTIIKNMAHSHTPI